MAFFGQKEPAPCPVCGHTEGDAMPPGAQLRAAREAKGWTIEQLLEAAGSTRDQSWLSRVERRRTGRRLIPVDYAEWAALCRAVGLDPEAAAGGGS